MYIKSVGMQPDLVDKTKKSIEELCANNKNLHSTTAIQSIPNKRQQTEQQPESPAQSLKKQKLMKGQHLLQNGSCKKLHRWRTVVQKGFAKTCGCQNSEHHLCSMTSIPQGLKELIEECVDMGITNVLKDVVSNEDQAVAVVAEAVKNCKPSAQLKGDNIVCKVSPRVEFNALNGNYTAEEMKYFQV